MEKKSSAFKRIIKDTLILFTITLIAGLCLGAVEKITREPIKKAQREAKEKAYMTVFDSADSFESTKELDELLKNIARSMSSSVGMSGILIWIRAPIPGGATIIKSGLF